MASKDDKGREDSDDVGLKDKFIFQLTLRLSDLLQAQMIKIHVHSNFEASTKSKSDR